MHARTLLFVRSSALLFALVGLAAVLAPQRAAAQQTLISVGDTWSFFRGISEPPAEWNQLDFDASTWESGPSGFGYGDSDDMTVLDDMSSLYTTVYIRRIFVIADVNDVQLIQLGTQYDDGFVAYVNGVEITRSALLGTPGTPLLFDAVAPDHEVNTPPEFRTFPAEAVAALQTGENVLAIQGLNATIASSDFSLIPQLRFYDDLCPGTFACDLRADNTVRLSWRHAVSPTPAYESVEIFRNGTLLGTPRTLTSTVFTDTAPLPCQNTYQLVTRLNGEVCGGASPPSCSVMANCPQNQFRRGDPDDSGTINLTDAVNILLYLFRGGEAPTCLDSADTDDSGQVNLSDAVFLLLHLFRGGAEPPAPGPLNCGADATETDTLGECVSAVCRPA